MMPRYWTRAREKERERERFGDDENTVYEWLDVFMITKKYLPNFVEPNVSRERDTKKKRLRARNARFPGAENTRENPRARGDGDDDNT